MRRPKTRACAVRGSNALARASRSGGRSGARRSEAQQARPQKPHSQQKLAPIRPCRSPAAAARLWSRQSAPRAPRALESRSSKGATAVRIADFRACAGAKASQQAHQPGQRRLGPTERPQALTEEEAGARRGGCVGGSVRASRRGASRGGGRLEHLFGILPEDQRATCIVGVDGSCVADEAGSIGSSDAGCSAPSRGRRWRECQRISCLSAGSGRGERLLLPLLSLLLRRNARWRRHCRGARYR